LFNVVIWTSYPINYTMEPVSEHRPIRMRTVFVQVLEILKSCILILYFVFLWFEVGSTNYNASLLQCLVICSLPAVSAVYSIWKLWQTKKMKQDFTLNHAKHHSLKHSTKLVNAIRLIALVSFSSILLENAQHVLLFLFRPESRTVRMFLFSEVLDFIVAVYAVWLLVCFVRNKKETHHTGKDHANNSPRIMRGLCAFVQIIPCAIMASATLAKPAMLAPATRL